MGLFKPMELQTVLSDHCGKDCHVQNIYHLINSEALSSGVTPVDGCASDSEL